LAEPVSSTALALVVSSVIGLICSTMVIPDCYC
jgi:hypothetical protein